MQPASGVASAGAAPAPAPPATSSGSSSEHPCIQLLHTGLGGSFSRTHVPRTERHPGLTDPSNHRQMPRRDGDLAPTQADLTNTQTRSTHLLRAAWHPSPRTDGHPHGRADTHEYSSVQARTDGHRSVRDRPGHVLPWAGPWSKPHPTDRSIVGGACPSPCLCIAAHLHGAPQAPLPGTGGSPCPPEGSSPTTTGHGLDFCKKCFMGSIFV